MLYIVEALRFGNREKHSYVVGVYDTLDLARKAVEFEECYRGGKYECKISEFELNHISEGDYSET